MSGFIWRQIGAMVVRRGRVEGSFLGDSRQGTLAGRVARACRVIQLAGQ